MIPNEKKYVVAGKAPESWPPSVRWLFIQYAQQQDKAT